MNANASPGCCSGGRPLRDLITGRADVELPGHAEQLLALLADGARADATT